MLIQDAQAGQGARTRQLLQGRHGPLQAIELGPVALVMEECPQRHVEAEPEHLDLHVEEVAGAPGGGPAHDGVLDVARPRPLVALAEVALHGSPLMRVSRAFARHQALAEQHAQSLERATLRERGRAVGQDVADRGRLVDEDDPLRPDAGGRDVAAGRGEAGQAGMGVPQDGQGERPRKRVADPRQEAGGPARQWQWTIDRHVSAGRTARREGPWRPATRLCDQSS